MLNESVEKVIIGSDNGLPLWSGARSSSEPMLVYYQLEPKEQSSVKF